MGASLRKIILQLVALSLPNNAESHAVKDCFQSWLSVVVYPPFCFAVATAMLTAKLAVSHLSHMLELKLFIYDSQYKSKTSYVH